MEYFKEYLLIVHHLYWWYRVYKEFKNDTKKNNKGDKV